MMAFRFPEFSDVTNMVTLQPLSLWVGQQMCSVARKEYSVSASEMKCGKPHRPRVQTTNHQSMPSLVTRMSIVTFLHNSQSPVTVEVSSQHLTCQLCELFLLDMPERYNLNRSRPQQQWSYGIVCDIWVMLCDDRSDR